MKQVTEARLRWPEYIQAAEQFLSDNMNLGKAALVQLLTARFPNLNKVKRGLWSLTTATRRVAETPEERCWRGRFYYEST